MEISLEVRCDEHNIPEECACDEADKNGGDCSTTITLPARWDVCPNCDGHGKVDHPAFSNGWTAYDRAEDPDGFEAYMAGAYDVACPVCKGRTTIKVADENQAEPALYKAYINALDRRAQADAEYRAEIAAERRMGA